MKRLSVIAVTVLCVVGLAGCSAYQKAQTAYNIIESIVSVAEADLPSLQATGLFSASEGAVVGEYLQLVGNLNDQYRSCITNAQNTMLKNSGKFVACLNVFSVGLADPKELAALRVLSPKAQKQVQLYVTAVQIGVNAAVAALGGQQAQAPVVTAAPTTAELHSFAEHVGVRGGL